MRFFYGLILLVLLAILIVFVVINFEPVLLSYYDQTLTLRSITMPLAGVIGVAYLLGMLSGWTVVGILRRSVQRVTERIDD